MTGWIAGRDRLEKRGLSRHRNRGEPNQIARVLPPRERQKSEARVSVMERNLVSEARFPAF
jgi:hypothetical protein